MPQIPQVDTGSIVGPGLETAERIKGARTRRSLAEMALKHGPAREDRLRRSQELGIKGQQQGLEAGQRKMEVGEEELEYKRHQRMLTAGLESLPFVQDLDQYNQWKGWMIGQGANEQEIPIPVKGMAAKDFLKFKQEVMLGAAKIANKYGIEGYGPTDQMKMQSSRNATQIRIADTRLQTALANMKSAGKKVLTPDQIDEIYMDELDRYIIELDLIKFDKKTAKAIGYERVLTQSEKDTVSERARARILQAERDHESWEDYEIE